MRKRSGYTLMEPANKVFWMKLQEVNREEWTGQKLAGRAGELLGRARDACGPPQLSAMR